MLCRLCTADNQIHLFDKDGYPIVRCRSCGLVQVGVELNRAELEEIYGETYFSDGLFDDYVAERGVRVASGATMVQTLARIKPGGRLLDVGCAAGFFLKAASEHYDVTGVEISAFASHYARTEFGLRVLTGDISEVELGGEQFDVVTMWNTIEHVTDPLRALETAASLSRPGTLLVLSTGDASGPLARLGLQEWNLMSPPYHLSFFTPRTIDLLLACTGFRLRRIVYDGIVATRGPLASGWARAAATVLGIGNVMTIYASNLGSPLSGQSRMERLAARFRPLEMVTRTRASKFSASLPSLARTHATPRRNRRRIFVPPQQ